MLKVKEKIQPKTQKNDELINLQNEIKDSIKNLYVKDQKNKKTIKMNMQILSQKLEMNMHKFKKKTIN